MLNTTFKFCNRLLGIHPVGVFLDNKSNMVSDIILALTIFSIAVSGIVKENNNTKTISENNANVIVNDVKGLASTYKFVVSYFCFWSKEHE